MAFGRRLAMRESQAMTRKHLTNVAPHRLLTTLSLAATPIRRCAKTQALHCGALPTSLVRFSPAALGAAPIGWMAAEVLVLALRHARTFYDERPRAAAGGAQYALHTECP